MKVLALRRIFAALGSKGLKSKLIQFFIVMQYINVLKFDPVIIIIIPFCCSVTPPCLTANVI